MQTTVRGNRAGHDKAGRKRRLRIAVLGGGGAMGGLFGGWLAKAGAEVTLIDVSAAAVDKINRDGLVIEEKDGAQGAVRLHATTDPGSTGTVDLVINFVKCYHTEAAIRGAAPLLGRDTPVLTLQNGWGNAARIAALVGESRVLVGLTYHSATLVAPGHVKHPASGPTYVGELDGHETERLAVVAEALRCAGFETTVTARVLDEVWRKLALNICTLPTAALLRLTADGLGRHETVMSLMRGLLSETAQVAQAQGIMLDENERWSFIQSVVQRAVGVRPSMLQDVEAKRRTEIDVINGAVVEAAARSGIAVPLNQTMVWLVHALEEGYATP